jgi:4-hydroxy-3-methylbut-2-enyl diphosphate reductase
VADDRALASPNELRHKPVGSQTEVTTVGWLPLADPVRIGLTAGASTPDNQVGAVVLKLAAFTAESGS